MEVDLRDEILWHVNGRYNMSIDNFIMLEGNVIFKSDFVGVNLLRHFYVCMYVYYMVWDVF